MRRMHSLCQLHVADLSYSDVVQGMLRASGMKLPYMFMVPQRTGSMQSKGSCSRRAAHVEPRLHASAV